MKTTVHVIGPKDTIARVERVALEFADRLSLITFIYADVEEVPEIIEQHDHEADLWLFTGRVSYAWSQKLNLERKSLIVQSQGSAIMKQLHLAFRDGYSQIDRLSMDTLTPNEVEETLCEMELEGMPLLYPQHFYVPAAELVSFHEDAYRSGKVDACITLRGVVYDELRLRGIPAYRSSPTIMSIRQALHLACQRGEANHFRKSQIAMLHVHINFNAVTAKKSYEAHWMSLKVQETILRYTEHISGALLPTGGGTFTVLSTRGALEQHSLDFPPKLLAEQVQLVTGGDVTIGIGYGLTALDAEQNASIALTHAAEQKNSGVVFVDEHGTITVALVEQDTLAYKYRTNDLATLEQLSRAGISVATYHKFAAIQASSGQRAVSATYIASRLGMTRRNANRILTDLEHCGLAVIVGEEAPTKGRPSKLYRIGG